MLSTNRAASGMARLLQDDLFESGKIMHIGIVTPLPPHPSGIADYSAELIGELKKYARVTVFHIRSEHAADPIPGVDIYPLDQYASVSPTLDATIVQIANESIFWDSTRIACSGQCICVLHDLNLSGVYASHYLSKRDVRGYYSETRKQEGIGAYIKAVSKFLLTRKMPAMTDYAMISELVRNSGRVLVHSEAARNIIAERFPGAEVSVVPHGISARDYVGIPETTASRLRQGIDKDTFVIGLFGVCHERKRVESVISAFAQLVNDRTDCLLCLVGSVSEEWTRKICDSEISPYVRMTGRVDMDDFYDYINCTDLCVNLRYPWLGEESGPLLRMMACGKPVVVTDTGSFSEIPNEACFKVSAGETEVAELVDVFRRAASSQDVLQKKGLKARDYVSQCHSLDLSAQAYYGICSQQSQKNEKA